eukprot:1148594-Pelagomonas_calceolata.AAC.2
MAVLKMPNLDVQFMKLQGWNCAAPLLCVTSLSFTHGSFGKGVTGGKAVQSRRKRAHTRRRMADNPPDPHKLFPVGS